MSKQRKWRLGVLIHFDYEHDMTLDPLLNRAVSRENDEEATQSASM